MKEGSLVKNQDLIVGIDLGTTNSLVAYIHDGEPVCVTEEQGNNTLIPSVVHFTTDNHILVGELAKKQLVANPERTIYSVKRLMGKSYHDIRNIQGFFGYRILDDDTDSLVKIRVGDKFFTPVELSAHILSDLKKRIENRLGQSVSKAVITVPAYFNDNQRQATRDAGKLAGLDVLRIVNEPTAAALAYGVGLSAEQHEIVAVYDLGGGTFDISILEIQGGIFDVRATNGDTFLGGDDFDKCIVRFWLQQMNADESALQKDKALSQEIRLLAEKAKKTLSDADRFEAQLRGHTLQITRAEFENMIAPLIEQTLERSRQALVDAGLQTTEIARVIMVGGSTRTPLVKQKVAAFFGKEVYDNLDPDEVVALGAAVQADILAGNQRDLLLLDITPLSLGIETVGGLMDVIIPRNSKVPGKAGRQYTTSVDGQKNLKIAVYQGERDLVEHNRKLGEFILRGIPPMPAGLPKIDIRFLINADGILTVKAGELRSGIEQEIEVKPTYGISEEDMSRMLLDSIAHAKEDMHARGLLEARNEANNLLLAGKKFQEQNRDLLSETEKANINALLTELEAATKGDDKNVIQAAIEQLNDYTAPLAHRAMDHTISLAMKGKKIGS